MSIDKQTLKLDLIVKTLSSSKQHILTYIDYKPTYYVLPTFKKIPKKFSPNFM